ncbi:hypothetical protein M231_02302 [Tremella mesenterica]|uniref:Uncharacterized protein n=1 Tax=Tremella mesenterica TaxID=5217 RepID=A0A4Q1BRB7_TREME|nr:uncharacterized protein TREMEDRAFT_65386 [Tremella mesenterica DSM 1558]EIW66518.1 hypothetical protein TREMEDRAFT_65386 [Tremella mesenterica DSM 1558]RXK40469.1 hypothetical protein M231_02302 [Tremella mesenterica]
MVPVDQVGPMDIGQKEHDADRKRKKKTKTENVQRSGFGPRPEMEKMRSAQWKYFAALFCGYRFRTIKYLRSKLAVRRKIRQRQRSTKCHKLPIADRNMNIHGARSKS